jgi:SAM-dependent methyltransferase
LISNVSQNPGATPVTLIPTRCAICGTGGNATEIYPANVDFAAFTAEVFSARRMPDRLHYRLARCRACGLVRSDPIAPRELLARLYAQSTCNYAAEIADLRRTYGRCLARLDRLGARREALLEIGCGNGFFLEEALDRGYRTVRGVEPGEGAVAQAAPRVREAIVRGMMGPGMFDAGEFDVICMFQVFDHVPDPGGLLTECRRLLRPGGLLLCVNHNVGAFSARLLGARSPIVDVEHTYLYDHATMRRLFESRGWRVLRQGGVWNTYNLAYLACLMPLPAAAKRRLVGWLRGHAPGRLRLRVPLGNLYLVAARDPAVEAAASEG